MDNELSDFYKNEQTLTASQKKKLKKKQKEYQEQLQLDNQINSKLKLGDDEYNLLESKLLELGFKIHNIQADGNCLFKSIEHQLEYYKNNGHDVKYYNYKELRKLTVEYLKLNLNQYKYFLTSNLETDTYETQNSTTDNDDSYLDEVYNKYCNNMLNDGEWGSELEIISMSNLLNCNITVYNLNNTIKYGEFDDSVMLNISFHKYQYMLGEHYNSLIPV